MDQDHQSRTKNSKRSQRGAMTTYKHLRSFLFFSDIGPKSTTKRTLDTNVCFK